MLPGIGRFMAASSANPANIMLTGISGTLWRTTSGTSWASYNTGSSVGLNGAATNGSRTVVVGNSNVVRWSDDLSSWTSVTPPSTGGTRTLRCVLWTGTAFIAAGSFADRIIRSTDGDSWSEVSSGMSSAGSLSGLIKLASGRIVVWGTGGGGDHKSAYSDNDGSSWTTLSTALGLLQGPGVEFGGKLYVAGQPGSTSNGGVWSWDLSASSWSLEANFGEANAGNGIATNGATLITHTGSSERIWTSTNGSSWTKQTPGLSAGLNTPFFNNGTAFVAGSNLSGPLRARAVLTSNLSSFSYETIDDAGDYPAGGGPF